MEKNVVTHTTWIADSANGEVAATFYKPVKSVFPSCWEAFVWDLHLHQSLSLTSFSCYPHFWLRCTGEPKYCLGLSVIKVLRFGRPTLIFLLTFVNRGSLISMMSSSFWIFCLFVSVSLNPNWCPCFSWENRHTLSWRFLEVGLGISV